MSLFASLFNWELVILTHISIYSKTIIFKGKWYKNPVLVIYWTYYKATLEFRYRKLNENIYNSETVWYLEQMFTRTQTYLLANIKLFNDMIIKFVTYTD